MSEKLSLNCIPIIDKQNSVSHNKSFHFINTKTLEKTPNLDSFISDKNTSNQPKSPVAKFACKIASFIADISMSTDDSNIPVETQTTTEGKAVITTTYNKHKQIISTDTKDPFSREVIFYNPKTQKPEIKFSSFLGTYITRYDKTGEKEISSVYVYGNHKKELEKLVDFAKKYENMSLEQIEPLYKNILNSDNSEKFSPLEFHVIEAYYAKKRESLPEIYTGSQFYLHFNVFSDNAAYRNMPDALEGDGKTVSDYSDEEFEKLSEEEQNTCIRNYNYKMYKKYQVALDNAFEKLVPLEKDCIFYRGILSSVIPQVVKANVGDIVVPDKGYAYTAFNPSLAHTYGDGTILTILTPKGAKISRNLDHCGEALFPRNAEYKVLSKGKTPDGNWRIELEYILPKNEKSPEGL